MRQIVAFFVIFVFASLAPAAELMPDFAGVPTGWVTDRYQPNVFANVGNFAGRDNVLGITTTADESLGSRPGPFQSTFYNTQGMQYALTGGAGDSLSADLWVPEEWRSEANGSRRTDMWGVMTDGSLVTDYPIIGFTNYGGTPTFRVWDDIAWVNLSDPIQYGSWNRLSLLFTGASYEYYVNGNLAYTDNTLGAGTTGFSATIMQIYNLGDPAFPNAVVNDYSAHWDNVGDVPEPATLSLAGLSLMGLGIWHRRKKA